MVPFPSDDYIKSGGKYIGKQGTKVVSGNLRKETKT